MSQTQQSLSNSASDTTGDSNTRSSSNQSNTTNESSGDPQPELGEVYNLIQNRERIPFLGLEDHSNAEYPQHIKESNPAWSDNPATFTDVVKMLPEAEESELQAVNEFVNDNGTVDADAIADVPDIDLDQLTIDPDEISNADKTPPINDYKDIVDPRRQALAALGYDVKFRWQVSTDSYTIINPKDAYWPAYRTFKEKGEAENIFGWVDIKDFGGSVDIYLFFTGHTIDRPGEDNNEDNDTEEPIYVGLHTGYDFTGGRAMDVMLFGFDPKRNVRFYSIGARRSRRHVGNPNNADYERSQGRTPIKEWWDREYENLLVWTDELIDDIELATATTIDFTDFKFDPVDFYNCLDIPVTYAESAVKRAKRHSPSNTTFTMWTLFYSLANTLETDYQGDSHTSTQFKVYADIATNILRSPHAMIEKAKREYDHQQDEQNNGKVDKRQQALGNQSLDQVDSVTELDGVSTEDELGLVQKREIAQDSQRSLFNYDDSDE